jgi:hypothetical protein
VTDTVSDSAVLADAPTPPAPPEPVVVDAAATLGRVLSYIDEEIQSAYKRRDNVLWFQKNVLPRLPAGVEVGGSTYDYYNRAYIELSIPEDPTRSWRDTALLLFRTRKALGISTLKREVNVWQNGTISNEYAGVIDKNPFPESDRIRVRIKLGTQLPPTRKIEEVTEIVPAQPETVKTVRKVVCSDPAEPAK